MKLPLMTNSRGRPDFLMTAAALALGTVLAKFLANGVVVSGYQLGALDSGLVAAILAPTFGAYTAKRIAAKDAP